MSSPRAAVAIIATAVLVVSVSARAGLPDPVGKTGLRARRAGAAPGYTLYAPESERSTFLVDLDGDVVHRWRHGTAPGNFQYLEPSGELLRAGDLDLENRFRNGKGGGGRIERLDWDSQVRWRFDYNTDEHRQHHDLEPMPNGHVLLIAWEHKTAAEAIAAGRDPGLLADGELWPDSIVEVDPRTNSIVWEWHVFDHLIQDRDPGKDNYGIVAEHPEKIDVNYTLGTGGARDWNHTNSVDYNAGLDQVMLSVRQFSEIWIIDHDTTTAEARGAAGDLLFRYGNPATHDAGERGEEGATHDQVLFAQHDARWIPAGFPGGGSILIFSNGQKRVREWSTVEEITPAWDGSAYQRALNGSFSATRSRVYGNADDERFFGFNTSGAQRLANGDTLITDGPHGRTFEVTPDRSVVWDYVNPHFRGDPRRHGVSAAGFRTDAWRYFRAERYAPTFPGLRLADD